MNHKDAKVILEHVDTITTVNDRAAHATISRPLWFQADKMSPDIQSISNAEDGTTFRSTKTVHATMATGTISMPI